MKERPILFSAPMVRAILDGTKTQARRIAKEFEGKGDLDAILRRFPTQRGCPYGEPGDRLWVRETTHRRPMLHLLTGEPLGPEYDGGAYTVDGVDVLTPDGFDLAWWYSRKTCPSIHMPRWASRILLEITGVRVERLQEISEADCWAEGIEAVDGMLDDMAVIEMAKRMGRQWEDAAPTYGALWESLNGAGSWDANPWVWVVEFKRVTP